MKDSIHSRAPLSGAVLLAVALALSVSPAAAIPRADPLERDADTMQEGTAAAERDPRRNSTAVETAHVEITTSLSGEPVAPGGRFALVLDITPRAGIHVYAPGDHDYRIVRLELEPNEFVLTYPMRYPPSVEYLFEPLNERVQVYKELFRLRQELSIGNTAGARRLVQQPGATLTVKGVLEYQACTDTICYPPEEVPLAWSVALRP